MALEHICWIWIDEGYIIQANTFLPPEGRRKLPLLRVFGGTPIWKLYSESKVSFLNIFNDRKYSSFRYKFSLKHFFLKPGTFCHIREQKSYQGMLIMSKGHKSQFAEAPTGQRCDYFYIKKDNCIELKHIKCI